MPTFNGTPSSLSYILTKKLNIHPPKVNIEWVRAFFLYKGRHWENLEKIICKLQFLRKWALAPSISTFCWWVLDVFLSVCISNWFLRTKYDMRKYQKKITYNGTPVNLRSIPKKHKTSTHQEWILSELGPIFRKIVIFPPPKLSLPMYFLMLYAWA